ncbi:MAG: (2Fe-2S)-binding protein [Beijerinckiaceae bacterium]|nr:(2Fe-2S)-binding protein [Beijerinckiaceae bacterium]
MIVCSCNVLSDAHVRDAINSKSCPLTPGAVYKCLGCSPNCGRCIATLRAILNETLVEEAPAGKASLSTISVEDAALCPA